MNRLPISKIAAILALPEGQREEVAVKAVEENQSLRELQAIVDSMKEELDETRKRANRTALERDNAIAVLDRAQKRQAEFEHECNELRRKMQEAKEASATGISVEARKRIDQLRGELKAEQRKVEIMYTETQTLKTQKNALREMLSEAQEAQNTGISEEAQAEIDRLNAALADAEKMAEYQARQREQAQQELLDLRTQAARGEGQAQEDLTAEAVGVAARTFITSVGYLPHSDRLLTLRESDRAQIASCAVTLQRWAEDVLRVVNSARDAVVIEGV
jgi:chromosome segregation ATPase